MLAVNYSTIRNSFKDYCDKATNGEEVIVTRKEEKNVVIISLEKYNQMLKEINNVKFLMKLQQSFDDIAKGKVVIKTLDELNK